ncbi:MAG: DNA polymerase III subunit alpha [Nitratireductor sp.]|nr:DNA polymerase III subunit alpha [Nitratireductor sp.]
MNQDGQTAAGTGAAKGVGSKGPGFVHLHVHSAYSLLEGALPLARLIDLAAGDDQPALAVTDRSNLFGALEFSDKAKKKGIQPIMGSKLAVDFGDGGEARPTHGGRSGGHGLGGTPGYLVLLAMNETGYANLVRLVSLAHLGTRMEHEFSEEDGGEGEASTIPAGEGDTGQAAGDNGAQDWGLAHIGYNDLKTFSEGLIVLTGGPEGPLDRLIGEGQFEIARDRLSRLSANFSGRLYVELQRHGPAQGSDPRRVEQTLIDLAYGMELPLVATNQPFFATRDDFDAHDALIAIAEGTVVNEENRRQLTPDHYFKSRAEMTLLFADLPEALENTVEIARRCHVRAETHDPILPRFTGASEDAEAAFAAETGELNRQAREGLAARLGVFEPAPGFTRKDYDERLEFELGIIEQMRYPGYFLIVSDFIKWAKAHGIPVGPGRGSGAGSLVAWSLTITDIDPMRFSLLFERFLNPERVSMPDFDIDFCQERREEVIRYVQEKYGRGHVAQIITFGTLQARAVLRDVGRVLQMPYGQVDRLAKLVPSNPANPVTLKQAISDEARLQEAAREEEIVARLFDISTRLEGLYRHASTHAAGIVIGDRPLEELVPLYRDPRSDMPVTQFSMKWAEAAGLVKFDFLGLKTLTMLQKGVEFLAGRDVELDLASIPLDDSLTYEMLARGETIGVFQLESMGMRKALAGMRPDRFEDIIALVALYRPGPMDNIPVYNARKNGEEQADYIHDNIKDVLKETHGVIIYQEQVMQIAQILSGYSLGEADLLRRAMGKKIRAEMDQQRVRFVEGAVTRGLTKSKANEIFDLLAKFADYGFNKSHAAAYALVSYQTAYLKARYPVEFLAASMQLDINNTDKLSVFHQEAEHLDIPVVAPSVQTSKVGFSVGDGKVYYALAAIKGVGEGAVQQVVAEREANGPFRDVTDFFSRIDIRQANRRTLENLICAGALDCFGHPREQLIAGLDRLIGHASRTAEDRDSGQDDMFGVSGGEASAIVLPRTDPWLPADKLHREFQAIGYYLSAHPLDEYRPLMSRLRVQMFADFEKSVRAGAAAGRLAGTVTARQERRTRTGKRMGIVQLSDPSGQYEAVIFEEGLVRYRDLLEAGNSVILMAGADMRPEGVSIRIQSVESLEDYAGRGSRDMRIYLRDRSPVDNLVPLLQPMPQGERSGAGRVSFVVIENDGDCEIEVELRDRFRLSPQIAGAIKAIPGVVEVEMV